ncbi:MAG: TRAM domain-containing protein [Salinirussus sp.]
MELPDDVLALYSAELERSGGRPIFAAPEHELEVGDLEVGDRYRVAVIPVKENRAVERSAGRATAREEPPVEEGEIREVEIEDVGDQGDGIARIGPGYVVFVPDTAVGDRVTVEIKEARENFAFGEVQEGEPLA